MVVDGVDSATPRLGDVVHAGDVAGVDEVVDVVEPGGVVSEIVMGRGGHNKSGLTFCI
jgi:hypothetical protein